MKLYTPFNIVETTINDFTSKFVIKPLDTGFGITLGNSLRRILLSNIPGVGMFAVKISGVKHEYDTIPGVKEDILNIILNLKKIVFQATDAFLASLADKTIENLETLKLNVKGAGKITAGKIACPAGVKIINEDILICEATDSSADFDLEIYINSGFGFITFKQNQTYVKSLGIIATDSNYSPVLNANYVVDELITQDIDIPNDQLTLTVTTNGSISPKHAFAEASNVLSQHLNQVISWAEKEVSSNVFGEESSPALVDSVNKTTPIAELDLSVRSFNCLKRQGIVSVEQLIQMNRQQIEEIKNLGKKSLREILNKIKERGYKIKQV